MRVDFQAPEYHADQSFHETAYRFEGSLETGWSITRDARPHLELGPGYRLLRTQACGICSTDLARHHLPFPLPQVTGHEVVAIDQNGQRYAVEINASHRARRVAPGCAFCQAGLHTHCPERIVLGIHDLPGGFGPWVLAPVAAAVALPGEIPPSSAVLIEPFAAALNAVTTIAPRAGDRVAVLGPRRLGMLVIAALRAQRDRSGIETEILAISRHDRLLALARKLGATETIRVEGDGAHLETGLADVVIDTTGHPLALKLAVRLARREVHLKSTHGQPSCGLAHPTELVVDELALDRLPAEPPGGARAIGLGFRAGARPRCAWLVAARPSTWMEDAVELVRAPDAAGALAAIESSTEPGRVPRADFAVVSGPEQVDATIRPRPEAQTALVRPRGEVLLHPDGVTDDSPLLAAVRGRGLRLSSSRCGAFGPALELMAGDERLRHLGDELVTHRFPSSSMAQAFEVARSPECVKAVIEHGDAG